MPEHDDGINIAKSGEDMAQMVWPFFAELIRLGASHEEALALTRLFMRTVLNKP